MQSYVMFIWLSIIKSIANTFTFSSCTFIDLYGSTCKDVFEPAYLVGFPIQFNLQCMSDNILQTIPFTNYTAECQKAPHNIILFYILLWLYMLRHVLFNPVTHKRKYLPRQNFHIIHWYTHVRSMFHFPLLNMIQK